MLGQKSYLFFSLYSLHNGRGQVLGWFLNRWLKYHTQVRKLVGQEVLICLSTFITTQRLDPWSGLLPSSLPPLTFQEGPPDPAAAGEGEQPLFQPPAKRLHPEPRGHRALPFLPQRGGPACGYGVVQHPQGHQNHVRGEDGVHGPKHVWGVQGPVREGSTLREHRDPPWEGAQYSHGPWGLGGLGDSWGWAWQVRLASKAKANSFSCG